jgi:hypothetical protein
MWIGGRLSNLEQLAIRSHLQNGYEYRLYTYGPVENVPEGTTVLDGEKILPKTKVFAYHTELGKGSFSAFSNLFRYKLIYEQGGWWVDTDYVCLRPYVDRPAVVGYERMEEIVDGEHLTHIASCIFRFDAKHPVMKNCYKEAAAKNPFKIVWGEIGPALLQKHYNAWESPDKLPPAHPNCFCPIDWFNIDDLIWENGIDWKWPRSNGIHFWNEMWRRKGYNKDGQYPKDCLYERLKRGFE